MYLLNLQAKFSRIARAFEFTCPIERGAIPKWTLLPAGTQSRLMLQLASLTAVDHQTIVSMRPFIGQVCAKNRGTLRLRFSVALHRETDHGEREGAFRCSGLRILTDGRTKRLRPLEWRSDQLAARFRNVRRRYQHQRFFLLAYGVGLARHEGTDDFDLNGADHRLARCRSLFDPKWKLTDPIAFLERLNSKGARFKRVMPLWMLQSFARVGSGRLGIDTGSWLRPGCAFQPLWNSLTSVQQTLLCLPLDVCRRMAETFPRTALPAGLPGVLLFHRPDRVFSSENLLLWINLMDDLFPRLQFVLTVPSALGEKLTNELSHRQLVLPTAAAADEEPRAPSVCVSRPIVLIDVDGKLPNLALMKLGRHFRNKGREIKLVKRPEHISGTTEVYASCLFHSTRSQAKMDKYRLWYGDDLKAGGSGVDVRLRLPFEIETLLPDYSLYPDLGDRAIGFLTRGCPNHCEFCIVPAKEGPPRQVSDLETLLQEGRRKLILLDDNLLAHPGALGFLEEVVKRGIQVNFNQSLDIRYINEEIAAVLRRVHCVNSRFTRENHYFSLNDANNLEIVSRNYQRMGFTSRDNVEFICMYGFSTTLAEDVARFRFLRSLPGAYVFVQRYQAILGGPQPKEIDFFGADPDPLIETLIRICFPQNMKSMETYYRWVSRKYAERFGKLHRGLVETIFRYNNRMSKGEYLASLAKTRK